MRSLVEELREKHRHIRSNLEKVLAAAEELGEDPPAWTMAGVFEAHRFLVDEVISHSEAEEEVVYPAVARILDAPLVTVTMTLENMEIKRLVRELEAIVEEWEDGSMAPWTERELRRILYGLYTVLKLHIAKEERVFLPLLEARLTGTQKASLWEEFDRVEEEMRPAEGAASGREVSHVG